MSTNEKNIAGVYHDVVVYHVMVDTCTRINKRGYVISISVGFVPRLTDSRPNHDNRYNRKL